MSGKGVQGFGSKRLVLDAQGGDRAALDELVLVSLPLVYNVIGRALRGNDDVDDLVQECMIRMIRGLSTLREPEQFRTWLTTIAYRQVRDYWRRKSAVAVDPLDAPDNLPDTTGDVAERTVAELVLSGQRRDLTEATGWLEPGDRELLALWWQETAGILTRSDLAAVVGVGERHLAVRLQRMRGQLEAARTVVAALRHRERCPELAELARSWDGQPSSLWRKRFGRHVRGCPRCGARREALLPPERLLYGLAALPVPALLVAAVRAAIEADRVGRAVTTAGHRPLSTFLSDKLAVVGSAAAVVVLGAIVFAINVTPDADTDTERAVAAPPSTAVVPASPTRSTAVPAPSATPTSTPSRPSPATGVTAADIFVAPNGADDADGSRERPFATLNRAAEVVRPGQTIAMRGGTYRLAEPVELETDGTRGQPIVLSGYGGERAVLDASGLPAVRAVSQQTSYWTMQDLEVHGSRDHAWTCMSCRFTTFRRMAMHDNARSGLTLRDRGTVGNKVLDSDFYRNYDPADNGGGGIGLGVKFGDGTGNLVRGNRAFHNADDGFDFGAFHSPLTVESNWSYGNGKNRWRVPDWDSNGFGFSLGGGETTPTAGHRVRNNAAWDNQGDGFGAEANTGAMSLAGNTAYRNGGDGFDFGDCRGAARDNLAIDNARPARVSPGLSVDGNSWEGGEWSRSSLRSADPTIAEGARRDDGVLPATSFLGTDEGIGADLTGG